MALDFITIDDITNKNIKNLIALITAQGGSLDEIQSYVDSANEYYVDLADQLQVAEDDILFPVKKLSKDLLLEYVTYNYSKDNNGLLNSDTGYADTTYTRMEETAYMYYKDLLKQMNKEYISGESTEETRISTTFGHMVR